MFFNLVSGTGSEDKEKEEQQLKLQAEMAKHLDEIAHLEQGTCQKSFLYSNLILILIGAVFLYVFFSINPFTEEQIDKLRQQANITIFQYSN